MTNERFDLVLGFAKFLLGTFVLGIVSLLINSRIQERQVEMQELAQLGQFVEHALQEDVGVRKRFSQYFAYVTRSDALRNRWEEYLELVDAEYKEKEQQKIQLEELVKAAQFTDPKDRERILDRIAELERALDATPRRESRQVPPRIYLHIQVETDRPKAEQIKTQLEAAGFVVPGIENVARGPQVTQLRYFKRMEREEARLISDTIGSTTAVRSVYIQGYETSKQISPRHYELWLAAEF